jgi:hypothetical protein
MRKLVLLFCIFYSVLLSAQITAPSNSITEGEYFWDTDPGEGNGTPLVAFDGNWDDSMESVSESISSLLFNGYHTFNIRVKDADGVWSSIFSNVIYFDQLQSLSASDFDLTQGEYFWDTDPGEGNGTPLVAFDGNWDESMESVSESISSLLFNGYHTFNIRVKDADGVWGYPFIASIFFNDPSIIYGCTDSTSLNYDPLATLDDGSCSYPCLTDTSYANITACDSVVWNGITYDSSGTYTYNGSSTTNNSSASLDGINDYINVGNNNVLNIDNSVTIETWINAANLSNRNAIYSTRKNNDPGSFQLEIGSESNVGTSFVAVTGPGTFIAITGSNVINNNSGWVHIAYTRDGVGDNHEIYINGIPQAINTNPYTFANNNALKEIGRGTSQLQNYEGKIDQVSIWNIALSQQEIQNYMNCSPQGNEVGLVGCWNFEEGSGNTAYDQTSNGNDGIINGATYDTNVPAQSCSLTNANGCDSIAILNLTILNSSAGTDTRTECSSYTWIDGNTYTANNNNATFNIIGGAASGCDSLVTLDLTIVNSTSGTDTKTECNSYTWIDGINYTASSNSATFNIIGGAANGCDSLVTLDLTIVNSTSGTDTRTECNSYTWIDGVNYTASNNLATFNITNGAANGCDSLVTLDLTIVNSTSGTDTRTECNSYTWIDGNTYTANNNSTTFNITNGAANGCDSLVNLDLTIVNSTSGTDTRTECNSYTWIDGVNYTASNNLATFNITNGAANGCDSLVTLDLTIVNSTSGTDTRTECNSYTWIDGVNYTASNNLATFNITNGAANGCDSLVTLDLTIVNSTSGTDTRTECNSYTWIDGINYTANNNSATFNITNGAANGCDSLVTLDLTINNVTDITISSSGAIITANNLGATYQWLDCDNSNATIPGETGQSYTAVANGNYAVELTENGCIETSACVNIITTAILENNFGSEFNIYPNPTKGNFSVDLDKTYNSILITITDLSGRLIESKEYNGTKLLNLKIDEPAGIYLLKIETGNQKAVIRLVKE